VPYWVMYIVLYSESEYGLTRNVRISWRSILRTVPQSCMLTVNAVVIRESTYSKKRKYNFTGTVVRVALLKVFTSHQDSFVRKTKNLLPVGR
jgi:hypothetical protein